MSERFDSIIVGGGVVGLSCARTLQEQGARVLVIDRGRYREAASTGNAGMIVPSHIVPLSAPGVIAKGMKWLMNPESPLYIKPSANPDFVRWLWAFQQHCTEAHVAHGVPVLRDSILASLELLDAWCADPAFKTAGLAHTGLLMLHDGEKARKENLELAEQAEEAGLEIERLDRDATLALEPALRTAITGSVYFRQDARVDPEGLLRALDAHVQAAGVTILDGTVRSLQKNGSRVVGVKTEDGAYEADQLVLAAGSWTPQLTKGLGTRLLLQPAKGYSVTIPDAAHGGVDTGMHIPCLVTDQKISITPMPGGIRFSGTLGLQGYDLSVDERRAGPIRRHAALYCGEDTVAPIDTWAGLRPASPDGLPYIGALPGMDNVWVASGHGMLGVTMAPITARLLADLMGGKTPSFDPTPFRVDRFD
ncbi:MAG: FAD-dependent oxidoreductase [Bacteroidetes bacterium]|nr:FAD-dependent oxidoreductase [Bacteroidota bacterium]